MQKRLSYILLFTFFILTLSGCSSKNDASKAQIPKKFESKFNANCGNLEISGCISRLENSVYTISITAPKSLAGLELSYIGNKIVSNINGVSFETDFESIPSLNFVKVVADAIDSASNKGNVTVTRTDGYNKHCIGEPSDNIYILQEQDSGNIVSLVIESADISINFIDFQIK